MSSHLSPLNVTASLAAGERLNLKPLGCFFEDILNFRLHAIYTVYRVMAPGVNPCSMVGQCMPGWVLCAPFSMRSHGPLGCRYILDIYVSQQVTKSCVIGMCGFIAYFSFHK